MPLTTQRQDAELEAEQRRGREMLAKYAQRNEAAAAAIHRILALRHDVFEAKLARVPEHCLTVAFHVLVESNARVSLGHDRCERGLAEFKRIAPQVVAVQFDQVEGVQERAVIMAAVANEIERGNAVVIAGDLPRRR